jgi:hypothetical protein
MKDELFKKVYIHSAEDLPKENEAYLSHSTSGFIGFRRCVLSSTHKSETFENISSQWWLEHIDWYLQPIESNDKEIIEKQDELIKYVFSNFLFTTDPDKNDGYKKLESELSQLKGDKL